MPDFFRMSEKEIILLSAEVAILLAANLTAGEQTTLGNFLMSVGQDIILGAGQKSIRGNAEAKNNKSGGSPKEK